MNNKKDSMVWIHSIKFKQILILFGILFFNLVCCFLFYKEASNNSRQAVYERMEDQASYYLDSMDSQVNGIIQQVANFYHDRKISYIADSRISIGTYEWREAILSVQDRLFALESANSLIEKVTLYAPKGGYILTSSQVEYFEEEDQEEFQHLCDTMLQEDEMFTYEENQIYFCITQSKYSPNIQPAFILKIQLNRRLLEKQLGQLVSDEGGSFLYQPTVENEINGKGEIAQSILGEVQNWVEKNQEKAGGILQIRAKDGVYLVGCNFSPYFGWLVQYEPEGVILQQLRSYSRWFVLFLIASVGVILLFTSYTDRIINRPLQRLKQAFQVLQEGNTDIKLSHTAEDEFASIYEAFNQMTERLHKLIDEVYIQKNMAQKAELKQLQSQINPHFLYNSFFLLSSRIKREDMEGAEEFADYLGVYFRFLTRNTSATVTLKNEVEHAVAYAKIQAARFAARIQVQIQELPQEVEDIQVPRLILQPLLENAFKHGLEDKEENGILQMGYLFREEKLVIYIEDNGELLEEDLINMRKSLEPDYEGEVTGLVNIHRRLTIYFEGEAGIELFRGNGGGLHIELVLPMNQK